MKYLLALALVAVASAATLPEPLQLAEPQAPVVSAPEPELLQPVQIADITPLMVPQEVMDEVALMVKFVDTAENVEAPDFAVINDSPVDTSDFTVNFVDEAVNADIPIQIRFMDRLPDSVVMPLGRIIIYDESDASNDIVVTVVEVADVDEETPVYTPMARAAIEPSIEAVKIVDSPQEASDDFKVNFVDVAEEAASYVPLALPSDIEAEMVAPQEASDADLKVNFVDVAEEAASYVPLSLPSDIEAENVVAPQVASDDFKVNFVDVAEEAASYVPLSLPSDIEAENVVAPQVASDDFKVNFVDFAEETPSYIPLPLNIEAVKIVDSLPEMNDYTVKIVDVAEENFSKQYADPRWR